LGNGCKSPNIHPAKTRWLNLGWKQDGDLGTKEQHPTNRKKSMDFSGTKTMDFWTPNFGSQGWKGNPEFLAMFEGNPFFC